MSLETFSTWKAFPCIGSCDRERTEASCPLCCYFVVLFTLELISNSTLLLLLLQPLARHKLGTREGHLSSESFIYHSFIQSVIPSFRLFLYPLFKSTTTQKRSRHSTNTVPEFYAEAPQATASERLAQGPYMYVATRAGVEPIPTAPLRIVITNDRTVVLL